MTEQEQVLELFLKAFSPFRDTPMILYGLGRNTQYLLEHVSGFQFAGLMDPENEGRSFLGYPVLTPEQAVKRARLIVVVARDSVRKIIYQRIRDICIKNHVDVFSVTGEKLEKESSLAQDVSSHPYWHRSLPELVHEVERHDVITFDLFDTLISRCVLRPEHIFEIVGQEVQEWLPDYPQLRKIAQAQAERGLTTPTLNDIYACLQDLFGLTEAQISKLKERELAAELRFSMPRPEMLSVFRKAVQEGKRVYLLTDMYLERAQLQPLLDKHQITGYQDILISCECKADKQSGAMFDLFAKQAGGKSILHIGDNFQADVKQARSHGLDGSYIMSGQDLAAKSCLSYLLMNPKTIGDSVAMGTMIAEMLSDPFCLCETRGKLHLKNFYQMGFVCFGPLLLYFAQFMVKKLQGQKNGSFLLCARDGYCIQKLYDHIRNMQPKRMLPRSVYFLTSRRAVTVASLRTEEDIAKLARRISVTGKFGDILWKRFGVKAGYQERNRLWNTVIQADEFLENVLRYAGVILERASQERIGFQNYLKTLELTDAEPVWMFDFITSGTIPYYLGKLLNKEVPCLCFGTADLPNSLYPKEHPIQSLFGAQSFYNAHLTIMKQYQLLESILTAPHPQLSYFNLNGEPVYEPKNRMQDIFENIREIQKGGIAFVLRTIELSPDILEAKLTEKMIDNIWEILSPEHSVIPDYIKDCFLCESEYEGIQVHPIWNEVM